MCCRTWTGIGCGVAEQRRELDVLRHKAWRLLAEAALALGRHVAVWDEIGEPLAAWPDDEVLAGLHMLALYRAGRAQGALAAGSPHRLLLIGRDGDARELAALLAPTAAEGPVVVSAAASGPHRVGKTTLAGTRDTRGAEGRLVPGGALFVDILGYTTPMSSDEALLRLLPQLGVQESRLRGMVAGHEALHIRSTLAAHARAGRRFLIVANNVSTAGQVRPSLPGTPEHRLLITAPAVPGQPAFIDFMTRNSAMTGEQWSTAASPQASSARGYYARLQRPTRQVGPRVGPWLKWTPPMVP